jgi:hypothetical protein
MKRMLSFWAAAALCLVSLSIALAQGTFTLPQAAARNGSASSGGIYTLRDGLGDVAGGVTSGGIYQVRGGMALGGGTPPTPTPTPTPTPPSEVIFADSFEAGNLSAWSGRAIDGGDLSVSAAAALHGTWGLQTLLDDTNAIHVTDDRPNAEPHYRARFYFDPNGVVMANATAHYLFYGYSGASTVVLRLELRRFNNNYQLRTALLNDVTTWSNTAFFTISDTPHVIELDWQAATAVGANNGSLTFWIDNLQRAQITGIDNDTRRIDRVRLGAVAGIDAGTLGVTYVDAFVSQRQSYIGPAGVLAADAVVAPADEGDPNQIFTSDEPTEEAEEEPSESTTDDTDTHRIYLPFATN